MFSRREVILAAVLVLVFTTACASASTTGPPGQSQEAQQSTSDCRGEDFVREVQAAFEANPHRARQTYIGERVCVRGEVSGFPTDREVGRGTDGSVLIAVSVGVDPGFLIPYAHDETELNEFDRNIPDGLTDAQQDAKSEELHREFGRLEQEKRDGYHKWVVAFSMGDALEAECTVKTLTPTKQNPKRTPGLPMFRDCKLVGE